MNTQTAGCFVAIESWMYDVLRIDGKPLSLSELAIYALIHGFCMNQDAVYYGRAEYAEKLLGIKRATYYRTLNHLVNSGIVVRQKIECGGISRTAYYTAMSRARNAKSPPPLNAAAKSCCDGEVPQCGIEMPHDRSKVSHNGNEVPHNGNEVSHSGSDVSHYGTGTIDNIGIDNLNNTHFDAQTRELQKEFVRLWQTAKDNKGSCIFSFTSGFDDYKAWNRLWAERPWSLEEMHRAFTNIADAVNGGVLERKFIPRHPDRLAADLARYLEPLKARVQNKAAKGFAVDLNDGGKDAIIKKCMARK